MNADLDHVPLAGQPYYEVTTDEAGNYKIEFFDERHHPTVLVNTHDDPPIDPDPNPNKPPPNQDDAEKAARDFIKEHKKKRVKDTEVKASERKFRVEG